MSDPTSGGAPIERPALDRMPVRIDAAGVETRAHELVPRIASLVGDALPRLRRDERGVYLPADSADGPFTLRIEAVPLPSNVVARTHVNTTSGNHVIQLSDRAPLDEVGEYLAQELRVLVEVRRRAGIGEPPARQHLLQQGSLPAGVVPRLSPEDVGLLARIDVLAMHAGDPALSAAERQRARDRLSGLLDNAGLRRLAADGADPVVLQNEESAARMRLALAERHLGQAAVRLVRQLAVPIEQLNPVDAQALRWHRARKPLSRAGAAPMAVMPGRHPDGAPITRQELPGALRRARQIRRERSEGTLAALRAEAARLPDRLPRHRLMIGGGAALIGRDPQTLLVNSRGRWHLDPIEGIVQSADQVRHLYVSGIGDPYQFAAPRQRLPLDAIRLWQDTLAARGPLVDGHVDLQVDQHGRLLAILRPLDGSPPVRLEVDGTPLVATGVPPEIVPGCAPAVPTAREAVTVLTEHLARDRAPLVRNARQALLNLANEPEPAGEARSLLEEYGLHAVLRDDDNERIAAALQTLDATAAWDQARTTAPGRVLFGDEVGDGSYDPTVADRWVIAGVGGAAIANAEIILRGNPHATVTMVGSTIPWVLENDAQYLALRRQHDAAMGGDGRLSTHTGHRLGPVALTSGPDGRLRLRVGQLEADAYVACLGRVPRLPPVLEPLRAWALRHGGGVRGEALFDADRQYLGYQVSFYANDAHHDIMVTGAASRMPPPDIFSPDDIARVTTAGLHEAPPESGNVAAGFMATATQAARLAIPNRLPPAHGGTSPTAAQPARAPRPRQSPGR